MSTNKLLDPITPGEVLREDFMKPLEISINKLSRDLSVPPNRISEIVNGKRAITADTALRLQRYFGVEAQFWLNLQTEYDLRMIKRKIWPDIERRIIPVKITETGIEHQYFKAWSGMKNHKPFSSLPFERLKTAHALVVEQLFGISTGK